MRCFGVGGAFPFFACRCGKSQTASFDLVIAATLFTLFLLQADPSLGAESSAKQTKHASIGFTVMDFDYKEFNNGKRLNHERGTLFGLHASAGKLE